MTETERLIQVRYVQRLKAERVALVRVAKAAQLLEVVPLSHLDDGVVMVAGLPEVHDALNALTRIEGWDRA